MLLEAGADVHKRTEASTATHVAVAIGSVAAHRGFALQALKLLVAFNAEVNPRVSPSTSGIRAVEGSSFAHAP
jgi:hypothetical protein